DGRLPRGVPGRRDLRGRGCGDRGCPVHRRRPRARARGRGSIRGPRNGGGRLMGLVVSDITMSLDGFVAGPNRTVEQPLGDEGERLHEWITGLASWREEHGLEGGETGPDDEV